MAVSPILASLPKLPEAAASSASSPATGDASFGNSLHRLLTAVDSTTADANEAVTNMLDGSGDVHTAMISLQRAEMALQFTVQVRNKFVQAYQDVMRMSI